MPDTPRRTCDWQLHKGWWLFVIGPETPAQAEWDEAMAEKRTVLTEGSLLGNLVLSDGGGPDPMQREQLLKVHAMQPGLKSVMVTRSEKATTVMNVLRWFDPNMEAHRELVAAMDALGIPKKERDGVVFVLEKLHAHLATGRAVGR